jgi:peptidyl-tRNA hydrolase
MADISSLINELNDKINKGYAYVSKDEYLNWIYDYFNKKPHVRDDKDEENLRYISYFWDFVVNKADEQGIFQGFYDEFEEYHYCFKLKDRKYMVSKICGQGESLVSVQRIFDDYDEHEFVLIGEDLSLEELKERELVQYIIINKDYIGKIDAGKFGVHIGHACTICAMAEGDSVKFQKWYQKGKSQKKIILTASTKKLEKLEKDFYSVRDLGYNEVEKGTLLAVSLGVMSRKDAKPFIKGLQLWKGC